MESFLLIVYESVGYLNFSCFIRSSFLFIKASQLSFTTESRSTFICHVWFVWFSSWQAAEERGEVCSSEGAPAKPFCAAPTQLILVSGPCWSLAVLRSVLSFQVHFWAWACWFSIFLTFQFYFNEFDHSNLGYLIWIFQWIAEELGLKFICAVKWWAGRAKLQTHKLYCELCWSQVQSWNLHTGFQQEKNNVYQWLNGENASKQK